MQFYRETIFATQPPVLRKSETFRWNTEPLAIIAKTANMGISVHVWHFCAQTRSGKRSNGGNDPDRGCRQSQSATENRLLLQIVFLYNLSFQCIPLPLPSYYSGTYANIFSFLREGRSVEYSPNVLFQGARTTGMCSFPWNGRWIAWDGTFASHVPFVRWLRVHKLVSLERRGSSGARLAFEKLEW